MMVNCPNCRISITKPGRYCGGCGHDFGEELHEKLELSFSWNKELEKMAALKNELASSITNVALKAQEYEQLLGRELDQQSAFTTAEKKPVLLPREEVPVPAPAIPEPAHAEPVAGVPFAASQKKDSLDFEIKVGQKWLLMAGILTMVFGVGYFLKYSFEQGWVTPAGRVAMAYVWGIVFLVLGDRSRKNLERFGLSLIGGGIAVLYFAAFAAFQIYNLFDQTSSFAIMVLITGLASLLSIHYDTKWLAVLGLTGGFLTPILLSTGQDNQIALMTYMTVLNCGLLGIAFRKKWDLVNILGFVFTYLLYSGWYVSHYADDKFWPAIIFLNIFYLIYSVVPFAYQFVREDGEGRTGIAIITPNSLIAFGFSYLMIKQHFFLPWVSVISLFYAVVFLGMASYLYRQGKQHLEGFVVLLGKALLFLIITVPIIFSKHWITVFWSAQAVALLWTGIRLERKSLTVGAYVLYGVTIFKFFFYDLWEVFHFAGPHFAIYPSYMFLLMERLLTEGIVLLALFQAAAMMKNADFSVIRNNQNDSRVLFTLWGVLLFVVLNLETAAFFSTYLPAARFAAQSVLWTFFSVVLILLGFRKNIPLLRKVAFGLFLLTVLKVFLFDVSHFSTPYRIISFIILGLLLTASSYLYYKYNSRISSAKTDQEDHK